MFLNYEVIGDAFLRAVIVLSTYLMQCCAVHFEILPLCVKVRCLLHKFIRTILKNHFKATKQVWVYAILCRLLYSLQYYASRFHGASAKLGILIF